jgi:signal transduction histidine kinase
VSHELRAPVTAIIGLSRLLTDESSDSLTDEQHRQVDFIRGSATGLLTLVNDLLDLAKAEAGRLEPTWADVDLRAMFGQLRGALKPLATRPEVDFRIDEPGLPSVRSDEELLGRVLRNLLTNALKFTASGSVLLSVREIDGDTEFVVADTGTGIPPELHERIFEEFYQVPGSKALSGKGTGLPYARRLAGILGGALRVESEAGRGSTFTLRIPKAVPAP